MASIAGSRAEYEYGRGRCVYGTGSGGDFRWPLSCEFVFAKVVRTDPVSPAMTPAFPAVLMKSRLDKSLFVITEVF
jgi:hypothetical protein